MPDSQKELYSLNLSINPNIYNNTGNVTQGEAVARNEGTQQNMVLARNVLNVRTGDVFSGQVVGMTDDGVISLLIGGKDMIYARLSQNMDITMGQTMSFQVRNSSGKQVSITPLYENLDKNSAAGKALDAAGLPHTAENYEMVNSMMENGMSIDTKALLDMARTVAQINNGSPASVVQMTKLGIPVNEENVEQFEAYKDNQYRIADSVDTVASDIAALASKPGEGEGLLEIFAGKVPDNVRQVLNEELAKAASLNEAEAQPQEADASGTAGDQEMPAAEQPETAAGKAVPEQTELTKEAVTGRVTDDLKSLLGEEGLKKLAADMEKAGIPKSIADSVAEGKLSTSDTLNMIRAGLENDSLKEGISELAKQPEYEALVKNELMNSFLMEPKDVANKDKVRDYYSKLAENTEKLLQALNERNSPQSANIADKLQNIKSNIDFMNDLNQAFAYVQLPLKMNEKNAHGDLYVYTNKKNLAKKDGTVSALLHLNMETLGTMDIHVSMNQDMNVKTHFIMQREEMLDFIAGHLDELNAVLNKRGYKITSDVSLNKEAKSVPEIMFDRGTDQRLVQKTAFDVRA